MTKHHRFLLFACTLSFWILTPPLSISAQFNAYVGYVLSKNQNDQIFNDVLDRYNTQLARKVKPMQHLNNLHGVDLGLRYRIPNISFELNWLNKFNQVKDRVMKADSTEFENILFYKAQSLCLGVEFYYQWFGIGTSFDWNLLRIRRGISTDTRRTNIVADQNFSSHFYVNFEIPLSEALSFSIRPYWQLPYGSFDFYELEKNLNPTHAATANPDDYQKRISNFGVRLLFVNGSK